MKRIRIKVPDGEKHIEALETWMVSWWARKEDWENSTLIYLEKHCQGFTDRSDAVEFKRKLEDAFALIGDAHMTSVKINKEQRP